MKNRNPVEVLAAEFVEQIRRGEQPSIAEYAQRHPELAQQIEEAFPALAWMEQAADGSTSTSVRELLPELSPPLERLGDFRIIREIGRGGMGVVYEAEQESLGRRVALKLLPRHLMRDSRFDRRFDREARAAAKLHHTNIVPVFGIGEQDGLHYYVMQYIDGQGLDRVLVELRNLRRTTLQSDRDDFRRTHHGGEARETWAHSGEKRLGSPAPSGGMSVAQCLFSGRFVPAGSGTCSSTPGNSVGLERAASVPSQPAVSTSCSCGCAGDETSGGSVALASGSGRFALPAQPVFRNESQSSSSYWDSVARIGVQAADALQYAHEQGIIHRDVKPANLLLDTQGTVWITDFGLAKLAEHRDLTGSRDILGTLRYMAPELFDGQADPRTDVYSLGLTLYELAAMEPAFGDRDRPVLIRHVAGAAPEDLVRRDPTIPRDLATVIQKAIEREPAARYQSACELRDDLNRFLLDQPVLARRASVVARVARWCRRNPALSFVTSCLACLLLAGFIASWGTAVHLRRVAQEREQARAAAAAAERSAKQRLFESLVAQARVSRWSGHSGQRFATLSALAQAVSLTSELGLGEDQRLVLRNEAIAAIALPDVSVRQQWKLDRHFTTLDSIDFDPALRHYLTFTEEALFVHRVTDQQVVGRLPDGSRFPSVSRFSPDGELLAVSYDHPDGHYFTLWAWSQAEMLLDLPIQIAKLSMDFSPDSRLLAVGQVGGEIQVYGTADGKRLATLEIGGEPFSLRWSPDGKQLAVSCRFKSTVTIWEPLAGRVVQVLQHPAQHDVLGVAWHPLGDELAVGCEKSIYLWSLPVADRPRAVLQGHAWMVHNLEYHPAGRHLVSHSWEGKTRLWDTHLLRELMVVDGHFSRFSTDGSSLAFRTGTRLGIWNVAIGEECVSLQGSQIGANPNERSLIDQVAISTRWSLVAAAGQGGIDLWDSRRGRHLAAVHPGKDALGVCFDSYEEGLVVGSVAGLMRYPISENRDEVSRLLQVGPAQVTPLPGGGVPRTLAQSANGHVLAVVTRGQGRAVVFQRDDAEPKVLIGSPHMTYIALSPDGRWAATGNQNEPGFEVWDLASGTRVKELMTRSSGTAVFSPDGKWLVTASSGEYRFWSVPGWLPGLSIRRDDVPGGGYLSAGAMAFAPDGAVFAIAKNHYVVQLVDRRSGVELATLQQEDSASVVNGLAFNTDGSQLVVCCAREGVLLWDLRRVREHLSALSLDWRATQLPSAPSHQANVVTRVELMP